MKKKTYTHPPLSYIYMYPNIYTDIYRYVIRIGNLYMHASMQIINKLTHKKHDAYERTESSVESMGGMGHGGDRATTTD